MNKFSKRATILGIVGNCFLFILKVIVGFLYNSLAVLSDAFNSLTDIVASIIVYASVKVGAKSADKTHPFGHKRAEPIAGLIVAIFIGILGFQIIIMSINRVVEGSEIKIGIAPIVVLILTMLIKFFMYLYTQKVGIKNKSTAILASALDHRNDVIISGGALMGVIGSFLGFTFMDSLIALLIGVWIIITGYDIGKNNIKFLMGEAPSKELLKEIEELAYSVKGVKGVHDVRAHYVGVFLQVEVHIDVDKNLTILKSHSIGKKVEKKVKKIRNVDEAFIHIDPI